MVLLKILYLVPSNGLVVISSLVQLCKDTNTIRNAANILIGFLIIASLFKFIFFIFLNVLLFVFNQSLQFCLRLQIQRIILQFFSLDCKLHFSMVYILVTHNHFDVFHFSIRFLRNALHFDQSGKGEKRLQARAKLFIGTVYITIKYMCKN